MRQPLIALFFVITAVAALQVGNPTEIERNMNDKRDLAQVILDSAKVGHAAGNNPAPHYGSKADADISIGSPSTGMSLADALTLERRASVWFDYARDIQSVSNRLTSKGDTTLLVPLDRAVMALPRKPHMNPDGKPADESQATENVENFLSAHIVPANLAMPGTDDTPTLHAGVSVRVEGKEGDWVVQPGDIKVVDVKQASNGKILFLDGVVKY